MSDNSSQIIFALPGVHSPAIINIMNMSQDQLLESVLSLPQSVRADFAFELLQSLDPPGEEVAAREFGIEIHERIAAHRRGEVQSFNLDETRAIVLERLSQERGN